MGCPELSNSVLLAIRCCSNNRWKNSTSEGNKCIFCDDLLVEILCRLPVKSLFGFMCVSKSWYHLINAVCIRRISLSPAASTFPVAGLYFRTYEAKYIIRTTTGSLFRHNYNDELPLDYCQEYMSGFYACLGLEGKDCGSIKGGERLVEWGECYGDYGLPFIPNPDDFLDCCNGLLLFINSSSLRYYIHSCTSFYYVCNPATRQCISILMAPRHENTAYSMFAALAFDPCVSASYKIVRFEHFRTEDLGLDIYSSDTRSWVRHSVNIHPRMTESRLMRHSVYFNGGLYRLSFSSHLVRFDLEKSGYAIELPVAQGLGLNGFVGGFVGVLMSDLCYANDDSFFIFIWSLESYKLSEWILKYKIYIPHLTWKLKLTKGPGRPNSWWLGPFAFHPNCDAIFLSTPGMIVSYDLKSRSLREIAKIRDGHVIFPGSFFPAFTYVPFILPFDVLGDIYQNSADYRVDWPGVRNI